MIPTVIYDADCRFCETARQWIEWWGRSRRLRFLHYEDHEARHLQPDLREVECLDAFRFLDEEGRAWVGEQAALQIARRLPGGRPIAWLLSLPGFYRLTERSYQWIATHRYRLFGRVVR